MKKIVLVFLTFFAFMPIGSANEKREVQFSECVDGDTAWFLLDNEKVKFRFLAIDTPESVHPTKKVETFGKDASEYTCNRLKNATKIEVEYDEKSGKTDKYGRNLGWIWVDGTLLQEELIRIGYASVAYVYGKYHYVDSLCYAQSIARKDSLGIWSDSNKEEGYCSTIDYTNATYVNDSFAPDSLNSSNDALNQEWYYYVVCGVVGCGVFLGVIKKSTAKKIIKSAKR